MPSMNFSTRISVGENHTFERQMPTVVLEAYLAIYQTLMSSNALMTKSYLERANTLQENEVNDTVKHTGPIPINP